MTEANMSERLEPLQKLQGREATHLLINEIYASIQGESTHAGRPCAFIRTAVCNQRCNYCDTAYAFTQGEALHIDEVVQQALSLGIKLVEITGGEPLVQPLLPSLCTRLIDASCEVLIETGGSRDISVIPDGVHTILDVKTPGSGEEPANDYANLRRLRPGDEVKLVLSDRADYEWSKSLLERENLIERTTVLFSPVWGRIEPEQLAGWIVEDRLAVRLNLQLHKYVWGATRRGV